MTEFALIVESSEVTPWNRSDLTKDGQLFWVTKNSEGWVEATSIGCTDKKKPPADVKTFKDKEAARNFALRWKGHPWWCKPNGKFEIVEIEPLFKQVQDGYRFVRYA